MISFYQGKLFRNNSNNKILSVISFINVNRDIINKGSYKINIFGLSSN